MAISASLKKAYRAAFGKSAADEHVAEMNALGADGSGSFTTVVATTSVTTPTLASSGGTGIIQYTGGGGFVTIGQAASSGAVSMGQGDSEWSVTITDTAVTEAVTCATEEFETRLTDNIADAWSIKIAGGNDFLVFDSTNSNEKITIGSSGQKIGFYGTTPAAQGAALTAQLTTITHTAPSSDDFAIQNLTTTSPFGFVTADEGNTVLKVIANLQTRLAEVEARLETPGLIAAN